MVMTSAMALMIDAFGRERRATAMGSFNFASTGAVTVGVVAGGPLIGLLGWRLLFHVFAGAGVVALVFGALIVRSSPRGPRVPIDYAGAHLLLCGGVFASLLAISRVTSLMRDVGFAAAARDPISWLLILTCALALASFLQAERRAASPMLKPVYFKRRAFTLPLTSNALVQFAYMGGFVVTPALLEYRYGWGLGAIALLLVQGPTAFSVAAPLGGYLAGRIGEKRPIVAGGILMVTSMSVVIALVGVIVASRIRTDAPSPIQPGRPRRPRPVRHRSSEPTT
jgi:MFS transporter, DHA2 family, methylenomycin A resistance protein